MLAQPVVVQVFEYRQVHGVGQQQVIHFIEDVGHFAVSDVLAWGGKQGQVDVGARFVIALGARAVEHGALDIGMPGQNAVNLVDHGGRQAKPAGAHACS